MAQIADANTNEADPDTEPDTDIDEDMEIDEDEAHHEGKADEDVEDTLFVNELFNSFEVYATEKSKPTKSYKAPAAAPIQPFAAATSTPSTANARPTQY
jgi:hypothetical protein